MYSEAASEVDNADDVQVLEPLPDPSDHQLTEMEAAVESSDEPKEDEKTPDDPKTSAAVDVKTAENDDFSKEEAEKAHERDLLDEPFKDITRIKLESAISDEIYIQMKRKFRRLLRSQVKNTVDVKHNVDEFELYSLLRQYISGVTTAVIVQTLFHNVSLVLQGLLAGLSIGHCVFAFVFAEPDVLVRGYQYMAIAVQATFYFCFAVSTVNAFDRFEAGDTVLTNLKKFFFLQKGGFNAIIWTVGTISSILMAEYDEYLAKPDIQEITNNQKNTLTIWRYLSLTRAICAIIGWFFVALQPNTNYTRDQLLELVGVNDPQKVQQLLLRRQFESIVQQSSSDKKDT